MSQSSSSGIASWMTALSRAWFASSDKESVESYPSEPSTTSTVRPRDWHLDLSRPFTLPSPSLSPEQEPSSPMQISLPTSDYGLKLYMDYHADIRIFAIPATPPHDILNFPLDKFPENTPTLGGGSADNTIFNAIRSIFQLACLQRKADYTSICLPFPRSQIESFISDHEAYTGSLILADDIFCSGAAAIAFFSADSSFIWFLFSSSALDRSPLDTLLSTSLEEKTLIHTHSFTRGQPPHETFWKMSQKALSHISSTTIPSLFLTKSSLPTILPPSFDSFTSASVYSSISLLSSNPLTTVQHLPYSILDRENVTYARLKVKDPDLAGQMMDTLVRDGMGDYHAPISQRWRGRIFKSSKEARGGGSQSSVSSCYSDAAATVGSGSTDRRQEYVAMSSSSSSSSSINNSS